MCMDCWKERGCPSTITPAVRSVQPLIADVYGHHAAGGGLHIVLDDWNTGDGSLAFCDELIRTPSYQMDPDVTPERIESELACLLILRNMTQDERSTALAVHDGYLKL